MSSFIPKEAAAASSSRGVSYEILEGLEREVDRIETVLAEHLPPAFVVVDFLEDPIEICAGLVAGVYDTRLNQTQLFVDDLLA